METALLKEVLYLAHADILQNVTNAGGLYIFNPENCTFSGVKLSLN